MSCRWRRLSAWRNGSAGRSTKFPSRRFGRWTASLYLANSAYGGRGGATTTGDLSISAPSGNPTSLRLGALPKATFSEIMRRLIFWSARAASPSQSEDANPRREVRLERLAETPLGAMAEMRKQALRRMLGGLDSVEFDARHLRLGPYAIHLATGRVTRDGEPVVVDQPKNPSRTARPWLPYDEKLLEAIYWAAIEVALPLSAPAARR